MSLLHTWIEENYAYLIRVANRYVGRGLAADLIGDLCVVYLENPDKYIGMIDRNEMMRYVCRTIHICSFSKKSRFYYKYKKHDEQMAHDYPLVLLKDNATETDQINHQEIENQIDEVFCILQEIRWVDAEVYKAYHLHSHSLSTLSDATGISKNTIYKAIKTAQAHLEENTQRIRGYGGSVDTRSSEGSGEQNSRGGLRMRQTEGLVEQTVSLLQTFERSRQKAMGRSPGSST